MSFSYRKYSQLLILACLISSVICTPSALASIEVDDQWKLPGLADMPIRRWRNSDLKPKVIVLALHGFMLHGGTYDKLARHLADHGAVFVAPDLCGFGRWLFEKERWPGASRIDYKESQRRIVSLLKHLRLSYAETPIVCLGESMGANLCVALGASHPELVDGLILSNPCIIRERTIAKPRLIGDVLLGVLCPWCQINLTPYAETHVPKESLNDHLVRTKIHGWTMLRTLRGLRTTFEDASKINSKSNLLLLLGANDQLCRYDAIERLLLPLEVSSKTVLHIAGGEHLLLETNAAREDTAKLINKWLEDTVFMHISDTGKRVE